ncbi:MAG: apiosidase-like domain-containing protein [Anaerolineae bacterium]
MIVAEPVERYGVFECWFRGGAGQDHPYRDVCATAMLCAPDGREHSIALFWFGDDVWGLRFSPGQTGTWTFSVHCGHEPLNGLNGRFECVPGQRTGGFQPMAGYPGHLQSQSGNPVWLMGDTFWRAFATNIDKRLDRLSVLRYLDERAAQGFNYVHADLMSGADVPSEQDPFLDYAGEQLSTSYFAEVDVRVRAMNARGITAGLVLAWSRGADSWSSFASDEARLRYARYIVARYSAMDVVFIVAGEWDLAGAEHAARYERIGQAMRDADPHGRMRAIHAGRERTVERFGAQDWMSFGDYQQMYRAPYDREATTEERRSLHNHLLKPRIHGKPVINGEYAYYLRDMSSDRSYWREPVPGVDKQHSHTRDSFRRASWVLAMAGGYFVSGFGTTYFGGWRNAGPFDVDDPRNDPAEQDLAHLAELFRSLTWWRLMPADALVWTAEGQAYCLAELGCQYLVYVEGASSVELTRDGEPETRYEILRFDPREGTRETLGLAEGEDPAVLVCPDRQDWAFVVRAVRSTDTLR